MIYDEESQSKIFFFSQKIEGGEYFESILNKYIFNTIIETKIILQYLKITCLKKYLLVRKLI